MARKKVVKRTKPVKKRVKKCTMHGGVSAQAHYAMNPQINPTYPNPVFEQIHRYMGYLEPFLIH